MTEEELEQRLKDLDHLGWLDQTHLSSLARELGLSRRDPVGSISAAMSRLGLEVTQD